MSVAVLEREIYREAQAARLLGVPQATLHYWLEGKSQDGHTYPPVIRVAPTGSKSVTWAEFVEAGLLRAYRQREVPMAELRAFIEHLRDDLGVPYPLAQQRPFTSGRSLVEKAQRASGLPPAFSLVYRIEGQLFLTTAAEAFVSRIAFQDGAVASWRVVEDEGSPVLVSPNVRFGQPSVNGISTEVLWEHSQAGELEEEIAEAFDLELSDVRWALAYELTLHAKAA